MVGTRSIALVNLDSGELFDTDIKMPDNKFIIRGYKMYNNGVLKLIEVLTKKEALLMVEIFNAKSVNYYNVLTKPFSKLTQSMDKSSRSRFKKKLIDNMIVGEYNKKIMLNPFIFVPRGDKNIKNCNFLTQRVWNYMFENVDAFGDEVQLHAGRIFSNGEYTHE